MELIKTKKFAYLEDEINVDTEAQALIQKFTSPSSPPEKVLSLLQSNLKILERKLSLTQDRQGFVDLMHRIKVAERAIQLLQTAPVQASSNMVIKAQAKGAIQTQIDQLVSQWWNRQISTNQLQEEISNLMQDKPDLANKIQAYYHQAYTNIQKTESQLPQQSQQAKGNIQTQIEQAIQQWQQKKLNTNQLNSFVSKLMINNPKIAEKIRQYYHQQMIHMSPAVA